MCISSYISIFTYRVSNTILLITVGMLPVTKACFTYVLNKPFCDWLFGHVQLVKASDREAFVVQSNHFYLENYGDF